ncbi:hypothetical protein ASD72_19670 [Pseudoxanthomonas sp. Root630]|nr:hypothetical protein ASD72_19670 [Pseudoxanthomonas sp. Root630]
MRVPPQQPAPEVPHATTRTSSLTELQRQQLVHTVRERAADELRREECETDGTYDTADSLSDGEALVLIECWRGAYQSSSLAFRLPRDGSGAPQRVRLTLPFRIDGEDRVVDTFTAAAYEKGQLSHYAKGRGLADCGESATWVFDGQDFRLRDYYLLRACQGRPGEWPALWRSRDD